MNVVNRFRSALVLAVVFLLGFFSWAGAVPGFSRQYDMSCSACHTVWPRLNALGSSFLANNYKFLGSERPTAQERPDIEIESRFVSAQEGLSSDFQFHKIEIIGAGRLGKRLSYSLEYYVEERGAPHVAGDTYLQLEDIAPGVHLRVGQSRPSFLIADNQRIIRERPLIYNRRINGWRLRDVQRGIEFYGSKGANSYVLSILNGNANPAERGDFSDENNAKDFALNFDHSLSSATTVGVFGYLGRNLTVPSTAPPYEDNFWKAMTSVDHRRGPLVLLGAFAFGENSNPGGDGISRRNRGGFLEANYSLPSDTMLLGRVDAFDPDTSTPGDGKSNLVLGAAKAVEEQTKLTAYYILEEGSDNDQFQLLFSHCH